MQKMYIAGPYRGKTKEEIELNIQFVAGFARVIARKGWFPISPHLNSALFDYCAPDISAEFWLEGDLSLLLSCDAVFMIPGWQRSKGSVQEYQFAQTAKKIIFTEFNDIPDIPYHYGDSK